MNNIKIKGFQATEDINIKIKDIRPSSHPEYQKREDLQKHIDSAFSENGLRYYGRTIFDEIINKKLPITPISFINHLYHLIGGVKGIIKYRLKHSTSSLSRYKKFQYETIALLRSNILAKYNNKIYSAPNGYTRLDVVHSVNQMCKGIPSPKVLEAGCGSGINMYLVHNYNPDINLYGFEYTNSRIASAINNLSYTPMINNLFLADICDLKLEDNSFDIIYTNHVLEQLGQVRAEKALSEMWRICKVGIVLSEPSIQNANFYERGRMRTLGYCKDLYSFAKTLPNAEITEYKEDTYRGYPNTSYHIVIKKIKH